MAEYVIIKPDELYHHGILGMKWGGRRYQNKDGSLTEAGKKRYYSKQALSDIYNTKAGEYKLSANEKRGDAVAIDLLSKGRLTAYSPEIIGAIADSYNAKYGKHGRPLNVEKTVKKLNKIAKADDELAELYAKAAEKLKTDDIGSKTPEEIAKTRKRGADFVASLSGAALGTAFLANQYRLSTPEGAALIAAAGLSTLPVSVVLGYKANEISAIKTYLKK